MRKEQIFGLPTYSVMFKWILNVDSFLPSFFRAFIPDVALQSFEQLDDHTKLVQTLQLVQETIHNIEMRKLRASLKNAPKNVDEQESQEQKDWLRFFKDAHNMTEEDVKREIKTPAVLEAFERARLASLPEIVRTRYDREDALYENLSGYIAKEVAKEKDKARAEEKLKIAKELHIKGFDIQKISKITTLPLDVVEDLLENQPPKI